FPKEPFAASRSPTISVSIKTVQPKKEEPLMETLEEEGKTEGETLEREGKMTNLNSTTHGTVLSDDPCSFVPEMEAENP
ncbi:UNVERIFIED_CONTAM: hypothetical protein K2H54_065844, partial [Gekko kuhli]